MDNATPCTPAAQYRTEATRCDGWTPERQALFLETLAHSGQVSEACRAVGMSPTSAYLLRRRADGVAFALGWKAAVLLARHRLEDMLLEGAIAGLETVTSKEDGVTRRRAVNSSLSMAVLNRLDRHAAMHDDDEAAVARSIGAAFAEFINLIAAGCRMKDVAAFLERHPDPLASGKTSAQPRAEAASVAQAHKLVEKFVAFSREADPAAATSADGSSNRHQRRAQKALRGRR
jgi:hypothetical protein